MSQAAPKQEREAGTRLQDFGEIIIEAGGVALRPVTTGYDKSKSAIETLEPWQLVRGIGRMLQAVAGHGHSIHPDEARGRPAAIDAFDQEERWKP